jgi:hypothetical protein
MTDTTRTGEGSDTERIRHEIDETRASLADTVEALAQKADVKSRVQEKIDDRKQSFRDTMHEAADAARQIRDHYRHKG